MRVELSDVAFAYRREPVLAEVSLALPEGKVTVVIGPSGSGKSTLLGILAGLLAPRTGAVLFDGRDVAAVPTERRDVGVVFQSYALFPHLTVAGNVAFGLTSARGRRAAAAAGTGEDVGRRVEETAALLAIGPLLGRRPAELSGGEQQRVALARAIAPRPALLLLDEPLSALDARLRRSVRAELAALLARLETTVFYVTHDQEEAMLLADHLVVLDRGRVVQQGPPLDLYRRPAGAFVASFLGEANLLPAAIAGEEGGNLRLETPLGAVEVARVALPAGAARGRRGTLLVRPEDLEMAPEGPAATVVAARGLGSYDRTVLRLPSGEELLVHLPPGGAPAGGREVRVALRPGRGHFLPEE
ncbi:MAG TPA: ABC transporter ATP-binding protein [Thermoanaerobaculia bacterium]